MPEPMRFKDAFPFRITKNAASPGLVSIRDMAARYWYPNAFTARVEFTFLSLDGNEYDETSSPDYGADGLLMTLTRQTRYGGGGSLINETDLAQQGCDSECPGAQYTGSLSWASGAASSTFAGALTLAVQVELFARGSFAAASGKGGTANLTQTHTAGPSLTWYDDLTTQMEIAVTAQMSIDDVGFDVVFPCEFASFPLVANEAHVFLGADEGGSKMVYRPPGNRIDESFAILRAFQDVDEILPGERVPSLALNVVETGRLSYDTTSPDLAAWDWADL